VVAAIATDALGPDQVYGVSMPSAHSSAHSRDDAADLAKRTGLHYRVEPIQPMVDAFLSNIALSGLAVENLQARARGVILMALSNQDNHLVLTTGNKSSWRGYSTVATRRGFNAQGRAKTMVWQLATWRKPAPGGAPIPARSGPSAERAPAGFRAADYHCWLVIADCRRRPRQEDLRGPARPFGRRVLQLIDIAE
jgi:NAD+ synthase (glutamine-hydrolysing)